MVTEAGKELLRNTINTANFHNKILEQNEMWKQWEIERGLTMMVSDDDILKKIKKNHRCSKHQKLEESKEWSRSNSNLDVAGTSSADRWDHSGFQELYPDEPIEKRSSSSLKERSKRWDHSGFHELYPDEVDRERSSSASSSSKGGGKRVREISSSDEEQERPLGSSSGKKCKKKCRHCQKRCFNAVNLRKSFKKNDQEECFENIEKRFKDIEKRLLLLSKKKNCKEKCHRCQERYAMREKELLLTYSKKYEKKPNDNCYDKLDHNERVKRMSPPRKRKRIRKNKKRRSSFKRRSYPYSSAEDHLVKWDHNGFYELYPQLCKGGKVFQT